MQTSYPKADFASMVSDKILKSNKHDKQICKLPLSGQNLLKGSIDNFDYLTHL